ncbi:gamma-crystallin-2-like [Pleurodeles waltl]|uniref:gamma-crystallin-2-like n=1 Tax=Pleurodeles waltl TaxID=8319 RepID=UPI00370987F9
MTRTASHKRFIYSLQDQDQIFTQIIFYEEKNFRGRSYECSSECADLGSFFSRCNSIRHHGSYRIRVYEREDFGGHMMEFSDDCPHVYEHFCYNDIHSCNVQDGHWIFYEKPNYRGRQYYLRPGEYRRFSDWGASSPRVGSIRRMRDSY